MAKAKRAGISWTLRRKQEHHATHNLAVISEQTDTQTVVLRQLVAEQQRTNQLLEWIGHGVYMSAGRNAENGPTAR